MLPHHQRIEFGPFTLDVSSDVLYKDGIAVPLRPQAMLALKALVTHSGRHLDHEQMMRQAWGGVNVSKHTVTVTLSEVRRALGDCGGWIQAHPRLGYRLDIPPYEETLRIGWHHLKRRTREGLEKAIVSLEQAIAAGAGVRAIEGASRAYLLLGVFAMRPMRECYPRFLQLHEQVVDMRGINPELLVDRGMGLNIFERRFEEAEQDFLAAIKMQPKLPMAFTQLAHLYSSCGRHEEAVQALQRAREQDALGLTLTEISVRYCARDYAAAVEAGRYVLDLHPNISTAMVFYARALDYAGDVEEALRQHRLACLIDPDVPWYRTLEGVALARNGRREEAQRALQDVLELRKKTYVDSYHLGQLYEALGDRENAIRELEQAIVDGAPTLNVLKVDPSYDSMRSDPRFDSIVERAFVPLSICRREALVA